MSSRFEQSLENTPPAVAAVSTTTGAERTVQVGTPETVFEVEGSLPQPMTDAVIIPMVAEKAPGERDIDRLAAGASTLLGGRFLGRGLRLLADAVLARLFGPAMFGLYAIGWTLTILVTLIAPMGLDYGVVHFGTKQYRTDAKSFKGIVQQSLGLALLFGLLIGAGFYLAAPWLAGEVFHKPGLRLVLCCFAFAIPLIATLRVATAATRISHRMQYSVLSEDIGQPAVCLLLISLVYWMGWRIEGLLEALVVSFGVALLLALMFVVRLYPEMVSSHTKPKLPGKELLAYSLPITLSGLMGALLIWIDRLFVGYYCSAADAGIYQAASQLSIAISVVLSSFGSIFGPLIADLYHRREHKRLEELFRVTTKWSLYVSVAPLLVMCLAPRAVLLAIFGAPYEVGWIALVILSVGQFVNAATGPTIGILVLTELQTPWLKISAVIFGVCTALNVVLVPRWGIAGAATATAVSISALFVWGTFLARQRLGVWPYDRRYLKCLPAAALAAGALLLIRRVQFNSPLIGLAVTCVVAMVVFGAALIVGGLDKEDRDFIKLIRRRLKISDAVPGSASR
jgi:O-antigen/teichoic acid export membrane protein